MPPKKKSVNIYKTKTSKRKTKNEYKEKNDEKENEKKKEEETKFKEPTQIIFYNGEPIEVPISKIPKAKSKWQKYLKYAKNIAIAVTALGALGYGAYNSKKLYDNYLHYPVDWAWDVIKTTYNAIGVTGESFAEFFEEVKNAYIEGKTTAEGIKNVAKVIGNKAVAIKDWTVDKVSIDNAWQKIIIEIHNTGHAVMRSDTGTYFILDKNNKSYLYDNISKSIMKDPNGNYVPYDIDLPRKIYDAQGRLCYDRDSVFNSEKPQYDNWQYDILTGL